MAVKFTTEQHIEALRNLNEKHQRGDVDDAYYEVWKATILHEATAPREIHGVQFLVTMLTWVYLVGIAIVLIRVFLVPMMGS